MSSSESSNSSISSDLPQINSDESSMSRDASPSPPRARPARPKANAKAASGPMSTQFVFTLNGYTMDNVHHLRALHLNERNKVTYLVFQPEVGANGNRHLQGYIAFSARKRMSTVKNLIGGNPHVEVTRGTPEQADEYCTKEDTRDANAGFGIHRVGTLPEPLQPGKRNDLLEVKHAMDEGKHLWQIPQEDESLFNTVTRNHRALGIYENHVTPPRDHATALHIHEGDPGTYKSHSAKQYPERYYLNSGNSGAWFDGYEPNKHTTIVADEFGGHFMPYTQLKRLCDRYGLNVETKGGVTAFRAKRVVITSNIDPEQWYPKYPFAELERRITSWFNYSRTQAPYHGLGPGAIVVTLKKGQWGHHPLAEYLRPVPEVDNERVLDEDALAERFDTQPEEDPELFHNIQ